METAHVEVRFAVSRSVERRRATAPKVTVDICGEPWWTGVMSSLYADDVFMFMPAVSSGPVCSMS